MNNNIPTRCIVKPRAQIPYNDMYWEIRPIQPKWKSYSKQHIRITTGGQRINVISIRVAYKC